MIVKALDVLGAFTALQALSKERVSTPTAFRIARLIRKLEPEYSALDTVRTGLIRKYGEEKDGKITVKPENMLAYAEELKVLFEQHVDIADVRPLPADVLSETSIPEQIYMLGPFITDPES